MGLLNSRRKEAKAKSEEVTTMPSHKMGAPYEPPITWAQTVALLQDTIRAYGEIQRLNDTKIDALIIQVNNLADKYDRWLLSLTQQGDPARDLKPGNVETTFHRRAALKRKSRFPEQPKKTGKKK